MGRAAPKPRTGGRGSAWQACRGDGRGTYVVKYTRKLVNLNGSRCEPFNKTTAADAAVGNSLHGLEGGGQGRRKNLDLVDEAVRAQLQGSRGIHPVVGLLAAALELAQVDAGALRDDAHHDVVEPLHLLVPV